MPVKAYVSRDSAGRPWPPDHSHETTAAIELVRQLWLVFNHQPATYAILANLHQPNADLVIITERGIGVVELKHYPGHIAGGAKDTWYADTIPIKAGSAYTNPHDQVQSYANQLRQQMMSSLSAWWLLSDRPLWGKFKIHTAVCFTHPNAVIDDATRSLERTRQRFTYQKSWERFRILSPDKFTDWVVALRFEVDQGRTRNFEAYHLTGGQIVDVATRVLRGTEWSEINSLMPTGQPYAYLSVRENGIPILSLSLDREENILGRDAQQCNLVIPDKYSRVSRANARISRTIEGIFIEDLGSRHGTFVNGRRITARQRLVDGQQIMLGGMDQSDKVCLLEFSLKPKTTAKTYTSSEER